MARMFLWRLWGHKWSGHSDCTREMVVRASTESAARKIAAWYRGGEGPEVWLDPKQTKCDVLKADGKAGLICGDTNCC